MIVYYTAAQEARVNGILKNLKLEGEEWDADLFSRLPGTEIFAAAHDENLIS